MSDDYLARAKEFVGRMTLEEKALLLTGDGWWATHRIDRLGIPLMGLLAEGDRSPRGALVPLSIAAVMLSLILNGALAASELR